MEEYKSNSHKSKQAKTEERKKLEPVVSGKVAVRKKNTARKFADTFISEDAANVKSYIVTDVLVPAVKKLIADIVRDGIEMFLYGGSGGRGRSSKGSRVDYVSYNRYSDRRDDYRREERRPTAFDYNELTYETKGDAEAVLDQLSDMIETYGYATVGDLYDASNRTAPYTAEKYGWTNISSARSVRLMDGGYALKLPRACHLD